MSAPHHPVPPPVAWPGRMAQKMHNACPHPACLHLGLRGDGVGRLGEATQPADHGDQMSFTPPVRKGHAKQAASRGAVEMIVRCRTTPQFTAVRILLPASFESLDDLTECSSDKDTGGPDVMLGQQPGLLVACHQVIGTRRVGQGQQPGIIQVRSLIPIRQPIQNSGPLEIVQHAADTMRLKNSSEFRVAAGSPQFIQLNASGHQLETPLAPRFVDPVWWPMRGDKSAEQNIAVEHDAHQARRAHSRASSMAPSIVSGETPVFCRFACSASSSTMRA